MERTLLFVIFSVFFIQSMQATNAPSDVVPSDISMSSDNTGKFAKDFASKALSETKFCESVLLPTDHTLIKKSLQALFNEKYNDNDLDDKGRLDSCCRSLHKCEAYKNVELSGRSDSVFPYCECVHYFRDCLKKLNTSISSDLAIIHSINATKCYAKDHPITKCVELEKYNGRLVDPTLNGTFFDRCKQYEFDYSQPKKWQLFDLPLIGSGVPEVSVIQEKVDVSQSESTAIPQLGKTNEDKSITMKNVETASSSDDLSLAMELFSAVQDFGCENLMKLARMPKTDDPVTEEAAQLGTALAQEICQLPVKDMTKTKSNQPNPNLKLNPNPKPNPMFYFFNPSHFTIYNG